MVLNRAGSNVDTVWGGSGGHDFGGVYPESLKTGITQPQSGAVNIYEALLTGYKKLVPTYTSSATLGSVRALWEPGYSGYPGTGTCYRGDTIWVKGDILTNTDEWDDMVLLHEYGHHVMKKCAATPPNSVNPGGHYWHISDNVYKNLAYSEGWADMFPSIVTDSIYFVNTLNKLGSPDSAYYFNVENPWDFRKAPSDSFHGGSWCEGGVAGAIWDVIDTTTRSHTPHNLPPAGLTPAWPTAWMVDFRTSGTFSAGISLMIIQQGDSSRGARTFSTLCPAGTTGWPTAWGSTMEAGTTTLLR